MQFSEPAARPNTSRSNVDFADDVYLRKLLIGRLVRFFDRNEYHDFHKRVSSRRPVQSLGYWLAGHIIATRLTCFLAALFFYLAMPASKNAAHGTVLLFGRTTNNRRALSEIYELLPEHWQLKTTDSCAVSGRLSRLVSSKALVEIWKTSALVTQQKELPPFLAMQLLIGSGAFALFRTSRTLDDLEIVILANDHSPVTTALAIAAKNRNIPVIYRQHAPVTDQFPPLIADLAILYDKVSEQAYATALAKAPPLPPIKQTIVILSPFQTANQAMRIPTKFRIAGICLSLLWSEVRVRDLIDFILAQAGFDGVVIRPHTANRKDLSLLTADDRVVLQTKGEGVSDLAMQVDLAFVGNSGIALELLHLGLPVTYLSDLDPMGVDPYGFVKAGIVPHFDEWSASRLTEIRTFFDADWRPKFANYDATIEKNLGSMRRESKEAIMALLPT